MGLQGVGLTSVPSRVATHYRSYGTVVADIAALRALGPSDRQAGQWRAVDSVDAWYEFEEAGVGADDGDQIVRPNDVGAAAAGRWGKRTGAGSALPAAHDFGGAQHTADTLADVNSRLSDATLEDESTKVGVDGADPLTADWGVGGYQITGLTGLIPNVNAVSSLGEVSTPLVWANVYTRNIQPDAGQTLTMRGSGGVVGFSTDDTTATMYGSGDDTLTLTSDALEAKFGGSLRFQVRQSNNRVSLRYNVVPFNNLGSSLGETSLTWKNLYIQDVYGDDGVLYLSLDAGVLVFNDASADLNLRAEGNADPNLLTMDAGLDRAGVGVALAAHLAKFHVYQNDAAGAIPVLHLEQDDIDDSFVAFEGTSAADGSRSISTDTTVDSTKYGAVRVEVVGVGTKWIRLWDNES